LEAIRFDWFLGRAGEGQGRAGEGQGRAGEGRPCRRGSDPFSERLSESFSERLLDC